MACRVFEVPSAGVAAKALDDAIMAMVVASNQ
jgi:hypothetical protein